MGNILSLIIAFPLAGLLATALAARLAGKNSDVILNLLTGLICGPVMLSLALGVFLLAKPGASPALYLSCISLLIVLGLTINAQIIAEQLRLAKNDLRGRIARYPAVSCLFILTLMVFFGYLIRQSLLPIATHDAAVYGWYGKQIAATCSLGNYPAAYPPVRHPPGLPLLYAWGFLSVGPDQDLAARLIAPIFSLLLALLCARIIGQRFGVIGLAGAILFLVFTPLFTYQTAGNTIDHPRIALLFLTIIQFGALLQRPNVLRFILTFACFCLALFMHLGAALIIPVLGTVWILAGRRVAGRSFIIGILLAGIFLTQFAVWQMPRETPMTKIFSLRPLSPKEILPAARRAVFGHDWEMKVAEDRVFPPTIFLRENLQMFSCPQRFGLTFLIGSIGLVCLAVSRRKTRLDRIMAWSSILFAIPVLSRFYLNGRYIYTIFPGMLYGCAFLSDRIIKSLHLSTGTGRKKEIISGIIIAPALLFSLILPLTEYLPVISRSAPGKLFAKFAAWKRSSHPIAQMTREAGIKLANQNKILILGRPHPVPIYYLDKKRVVFVFPEHRKLIRSLNKIKTIKKLQKWQIGAVLRDPHFEKTKAYQKSGLAEICQDTRLTQQIAEAGGWRLLIFTPQKK